MQSSTKNVSFWSIRGNVLTLQTAHGSFIILYQMVLHVNVKFLTSKQKKIPKMDTKMLKQ